MGKFLLGLIVGAAMVAIPVAFNDGAATQVKAAGAVAAQQVEEVQGDYCRAKVLEETRCFQNPAMTAKKCEELLARSCPPL